MLGTTQNPLPNLEAGFVYKQPQFPDMTSNYISTVVQPREQAEAAQQATQAILATLSVQTIPTPNTTPPAPSTHPEDWYKSWIYNEESGNDPTKWNGSGCLGLGQACPASKLLAVCPQEDYACEDQFFTSYMISRYGSWENAYNAHLSQGWW